jgi:hypothetical protein
MDTRHIKICNLPISIVCIILLLYIALSVLLRIMASDYHFGISKTIRFPLYLPVRTITSWKRRREGNQIILSVALKLNTPMG